MRIYRWTTDGEWAASIDDELAARVDAVKAARPEPAEHVEPVGLLDASEIEAIDLIYREGRRNDTDTH